MLIKRELKVKNGLKPNRYENKINFSEKFKKYY